VGSLDYEQDTTEPDRLQVFNAAYLLAEGGQRRTVYRKMHLVPFGEYMPLREILPAASSNLVSSDLVPGREPVIFQLSKPALPIAPLICFEDTLGDLTRRTCLQGAHLLINLTNDGWFQHTAGAQQHLDNAVFRAVENRRPLVRSTNTGMTGMVDAMGRWESWVNPFTEGIVLKDILVPNSVTPTFYTRHGDWMAWLSTLVSGVWLAAGGLSRWSRRASQSLHSGLSSQ
jgi:apolipoprotein N-acyltransferase